MSPRPHTCYLICATPRSGSYLLCEALQNTGLAGQPEEYFVSGIPNWQPGWRLDDYAAYLSEALDRGTGPNGVFGAKVMWAWFRTFTELLGNLAEREGTTLQAVLALLFPGLKFVWITRRDKARQAISHYRALRTNVWRLTSGEAAGSAEVPPPSIDVIDRGVHAITTTEVSWQTFFFVHGIEPHTVVYEDLAAAYGDTALRVLGYLGIHAPADLQLGERRMRRQSDERSEVWAREYYEHMGRPDGHSR